MNPNEEISIRLKERFEFYVIALIFTILGLSIQTASFGINLLSDSFELLGWGFLFVSGLTGLSRLEWIPVAYSIHAEIQNWQSEAARSQQFKQTGQTEVPVIDDAREFAPIEEVLLAQNAEIARLKPKAKNIEKWTSIKYTIHKWTFILGLLFLLLSRSYGPLTNIVSHVFSVNT